jgi:hypothetical protein
MPRQFTALVTVCIGDDYATTFLRPKLRGPQSLQTKERQGAVFLRESILAGGFARGQKLKQAEIAKRLDISIMRCARHICGKIIKSTVRAFSGKSREDTK